MLPDTLNYVLMRASSYRNILPYSIVGGAASLLLSRCYSVSHPIKYIGVSPKVMLAPFPLMPGTLSLISPQNITARFGLLPRQRYRLNTVCRQVCRYCVGERSPAVLKSSATGGSFIRNKIISCYSSAHPQEYIGVSPKLAGA